MVSLFTRAQENKSSLHSSLLSTQRASGTEESKLILLLPLLLLLLLLFLLINASSSLSSDWVMAAQSEKEMKEWVDAFKVSCQH